MALTSGAKARIIGGDSGTAEAVPFHKTIYAASTKPVVTTRATARAKDWFG
jgi:hypothetical protein